MSKNVLFLCAVLRWLNGMRERKPKLLDERKHWGVLKEWNETTAGTWQTLLIAVTYTFERVVGKGDQNLLLSEMKQTKTWDKEYLDLAMVLCSLNEISQRLYLWIWALEKWLFSSLLFYFTGIHEYPKWCFEVLIYVADCGYFT